MIANQYAMTLSCFMLYSLLFPSSLLAKNTSSGLRSVQTQPHNDHRSIDATQRQSPADRSYPQWNRQALYGHTASQSGPYLHPDSSYAYRKPYHSTRPAITIVYQAQFQTPNHVQHPRVSFVLGQILPASFRHTRYRVDDWSGHQLEQPLYGRYWIQVDGHYLLIREGSFRIEQVL